MRWSANSTRIVFITWKGDPCSALHPWWRPICFPSVNFLLFKWSCICVASFAHGGWSCCGRVCARAGVPAFMVGVYPGEELLDDAVILCNFLRDQQTTFCSGHTISDPPTVPEGSVSKQRHLLFHFLVIKVLVGVTSQTLTCRPRAPVAQVRQRPQPTARKRPSPCASLRSKSPGQPHSGGGAHGIQGHV